MKRQKWNQQTVYSQLNRLMDADEKEVVVSHHRRRRPNRGGIRRSIVKHSPEVLKRLSVEFKVLDLLADKLVVEEWDDLNEAADILRTSLQNIQNLIKGM